jgi:hypothetical protein
VKYWEIIADNLSKAGSSWGWVSTVDSQGRIIWIAEAHRYDGKRFVMPANEKLTAFLKLESTDRNVSGRPQPKNNRQTATGNPLGLVVVRSLKNCIDIVSRPQAR